MKITINTNDFYQESSFFSEEKLTELLRNEMADELKDAIRQELRAKMAKMLSEKSIAKMLREKIKQYIIEMSPNELYFRDEWRDHLVQLAKKHDKKVLEKIDRWIDDGDFYSKITDSLGYIIADKFVQSIKNGD